MIITQTPFRISFFGGGTDYKPFFEKYGGAVLTTSFDKYCYVTVRHLLPFFNYKNQLTYSKIERTNSADEFEHPSVRNAMKMLDMYELRIVYEADLPAQSGLGSSSAFAVGMLNAFYALKGKHVSKHKLSEDAIYLEREMCNERGGWQDQIGCAYGGMNRVDFSEAGFDVRPIIISKARKRQLNKHLMLFFTGLSRLSSEIAEKQEKAVSSKTAELLEMKRLVDVAEEILTSKADICDFGRLLDYAWTLKRGLTTVISNNFIDELYKKAKDNGALGGKVLGAGGGGFFLIFAEPEFQPAIKAALEGLLCVPFEFEDAGTRIMYYSPEDYALPTEIQIS